ncbi:MAG: NUDIX domain-containing protein [Clostridiales bacterium]|nr:NUDIX domain-containing protein [Clostridiales bacterium]
MNFKGDSDISYLHTDTVLYGCPLKDAREIGVKVGVSVFLVTKEKKILVGKRQDGSWGLPGGGMIAGETSRETAVRETAEETSIEIIEPDTMEFFNFTNDIFLKTKGEHWITLYYICNYNNFKGEAQRVELDKCEEWKWVSLDNLPQPVFCNWDKEPFMTHLKTMI